MAGANTLRMCGANKMAPPKGSAERTLRKPGNNGPRIRQMYGIISDNEVQLRIYVNGTVRHTRLPTELAQTHPATRAPPDKRPWLPIPFVGPRAQFAPNLSAIFLGFPSLLLVSR